MEKESPSDRFEAERPRYETFTSKLKMVICDLLKSESIPAEVESRTKSIESFREKINRSGKNYSDPLAEVTDIVGIRLVLRTVADVEQVGALVVREFLVDHENSVRKIDDLEADRFGYLSEHFIVRLKEPRARLPEWSAFSGLVAEIQVRTILQHAWASVEHSLNYKNEIDIPKIIRRRLFRLSALFELADQELDQISEDVAKLTEQYKEQVKAEAGGIELNVDSLRAYLENSNIISYWAKFIKQLGVGIGSIGMISRDVEMADFVGIKTIGEINAMLEEAKSWGENYLREFYISTFDNPVPKGKCSTDLNGIFTIFLIGTYPDKFTDGLLDGKFGFGKPERATVPAKRYNPRFSTQQ